MFSAISAHRIVCPLPPFASPLNLMHIDAHRSANCRDCSPVSHWCVFDLSNSCLFYTLLLELCVPDSESKREIKEMCNAFSDGRSVSVCQSTRPSAQNGLTANWCELRQTSTKPSLTMYRVNSQGCSEDVAVVHQWNLKSRSRQESGQSACHRSEFTCFVFSYSGPHFLAECRSWNLRQIQPRQF